ncbi:putative two-component system response regulator [Panacagrimonas perspica]|uniref:Putative two-component system response regulator n=1 Tax=Panacagrimonas perspica TaxID=381431 RepID=A0A4S3K921_9GAMM|nr:two-component system response regulator [Panacagrimonas perspica]TDU24361.1 putative two-component system response regulator [Panacagrimonas perspica]THD04749.1 two-component system response regulator [Panacagrimonas perspica]
MDDDSGSDRDSILVVDDIPANIEVLSGILRGEYRVRAATNGVRALEIAAGDSAPDLILLDVMMPDMDGLTVCRRLKADLRTRHIPVIFVTAMSEIDDEAQGFEAGCVDYVTKPVSPSIVLARVRTQLSLANQNRALERQVRIRTSELERTRRAVIRCLGKASEFKDDNTGLHVVRMSQYSRALGLAVGMSEVDADLLMLASPMHDVGKIGVPDSILKKPGKLTPEEWALMQQHVHFGALILGDQDSELLQMAKTIALTHHEKWDGSGYPAGLAGEDIPLVGRITALADVFDALTSVRPYKRAWSLDETVDYIRKERGRHFDPLLVDKLAQVLPEFDRIKTYYADQAEGHS